MALPFQITTFNQLRGEATHRAIDMKPLVNAEIAIGGFFDLRGAFVKRKGGEKYVTHSNEIDGGFYFEYSGGSLNKNLIVAGGNVYLDTSTTPAYSSLTSGAVPDFATFTISDDLFSSSKDLVLIATGEDPVISYDGTSFSNVGIARPTTPPNLASSNGAGSLNNNGVYKVRVTYVNADGVESNPSNEVEITLGVSHDTITLTNIPVSSDSQVTKRFIYMTSDGGNTFLFNQEINDNTTTTGTILSESAGKLLEFDHDVPPEMAFIETWKDRMVGSGDPAHPNRFYISKQYAPFYWPQGELDEAGQIYFDVGNNEPITGIKVFYDVVLIYKRDNIFVLSGSAPVNYYLEEMKTDTQAGCIGNKAIRTFNNWSYFVGVDGLYRTNGVVVQEVSNPISDYFNLNSTVDRFKINKSFIETSNLVVDRENDLILFSTPTEGNTVPNMCFCLGIDGIVADEAGEADANWSSWPGFETTAAWEVRENGSNIWFRGDSNGVVYRMNQLDGDGSNITSLATSSTSNTLTDTAQSWTTDAYKFLRVNIIRGTGKGQERTILSNTSDTLTVDSNWLINPDTTSEYAIGGIEYVYRHSWNDYGNPSLSKRWRYVRPRISGIINSNFQIDFSFGFRFRTILEVESTFFLSNASLWDVAFWDQDEFDSVELLQDKFPVPGGNIHKWSTFEVKTDRAGEPLVYSGCDKMYQTKGGR